MKSRNPVIQIDELQLYFGEPYVIDLEGTHGAITVYVPYMEDIIRVGQNNFYSGINPFVTNTTSYRLMLWKSNIDWCVLSDFELFIMLKDQIDNEVASLLFHDLNWSNFELYTKKINDEEVPVLYSDIDDIEITEEVYFHFSQYIRKMINMEMEEKITEDSVLKQWYIKKDEREIENKEKDNEESGGKNYLKNLVSACVNHPGFKYKPNELKEINIYQFYDSVNQLQFYEKTTSCLKGMFSGMVDGSKLKPESYNFIRTK